MPREAYHVGSNKAVKVRKFDHGAGIAWNYCELEDDLDSGW